VIPRPDLLRIASYNVHSCRGTDGRCDAARIARVIDELGCDTVGLQEVDNRAGPRSDSEQLTYIANLTGMSAVAGSTIVHHEGSYGNALLTRRRIHAVRRHDFSHRSFEPRGALDVELRTDGGRVRVIVTHLGLRPAERRVQVRQLLRLLEDAPADVPVVVLGDINEWLPVGRPLRWLHRELGRAPAPRTFPSALPLFALDRVWARPAAALHGVDVHVSPASRVASDHLPVKAEVALRGHRERRADATDPRAAANDGHGAARRRAGVEP